MKKFNPFIKGTTIQLSIFAILHIIRIVVGKIIVYNCPWDGGSSCGAVTVEADFGWQIILFLLIALYGVVASIVLGVKRNKSEFSRGFFVSSIIGSIVTAFWFLYWLG